MARDERTPTRALWIAAAVALLILLVWFAARAWTSSRPPAEAPNVEPVGILAPARPPG